jgi:hypothetical protein
MYCIETRNRIKIVLAAYAYEYHDDPLMTDSQFDNLAKSINLEVSTNRPDLDKWFVKNYSPYTGQWIRVFPEILEIQEKYDTLKNFIS